MRTHSRWVLRNNDKYLAPPAGAGGTPVPVKDITNAMFFASAIIAQSYIQRVLAQVSHVVGKWDELSGFYPVGVILVEAERSEYDCCESR